MREGLRFCGTRLCRRALSELRRGRRAPFAVSAAVHLLALLGFELVRCWHVDELSPPPLRISLSFSVPQLSKSVDAPASVRKGGRHARAAAKPITPTLQPHQELPELVQPADPAPVPEALNSELPTANASGSVDGVEGGTSPGSSQSVGSDVGANTHAPAPPSMVSGAELAKRCLSCPAPSLLPRYRKAGTVIAMKLRLCLDVKGEISLLELLQGVAPQADLAVLDTIKTWRYLPYQTEAGPQAVCARLHFAFVGRS